LDIIDGSLKNNYNLIPFKFDTNCNKQPTTFEVKFLYQDIVYRYGLKNKPRARENQYFQREYQI